MADNEVIVERPVVRDAADRVVVEERVIKRRDRTGPVAFLLVAAFIVTYAMLMVGDRASFRSSVTAPPPVSTAEVPAPPAPATPN